VGRFGVSRPFDQSASVGARRGFQVSGGPEAILRSQAVLWLDALYSNAGQTATNLGTGGTAMNAQLGSSASADSNDPLWLASEGQPYVYLPGVNQNYLSVPDSAALDITGDIDIRLRVAMDDWTPAGNQVLCGKWATNQFSYELTLTTSGTLAWNWSADGTTSSNLTSSANLSSLADGAVKWVRVTFDVNNGASGRTAEFFTSDDGTTWTALGTAQTSAGVTSIFAGTALLGIGARTNGPVACAAKIYRAQILNGIGGTVALDVDTSVLTTGSATSFTEKSANAATVTINRTTSGRKSVAVVRQPVWLFGSDDRMDVPDNADLDFSGSQSFTVIAVARVFSTVVVNARLVDKMDSVALNGWGLFLNATPAAQATMNGTSYLATPVSSTITTGTMSVLGMRRDASVPNLLAFLNTTLGTASTVTRPDVSNAQTVRIGADRSGVNALAAELAAVAVFRRVLSSDELRQIVTYYQTRYA
jgi:hypothetical protein